MFDKIKAEPDTQHLSAMPMVIEVQGITQERDIYTHLDRISMTQFVISESSNQQEI